MFAAFQKSMSFATFSTNTVTEPDRRAAIAGLFAAASRGELHAVMDELLPLEQAVLGPPEDGSWRGVWSLRPAYRQGKAPSSCPQELRPY